MELKVKMAVNKTHQIEAIFDGTSIQDAIKAAGCLLDFEGECGNCKSQNITLQTRSSVSKKDGKAFKYTEYGCRDCKWVRPWGAYQDGSGFFLKNWREGYVKEETPGTV